MSKKQNAEQEVLQEASVKEVIVAVLRAIRESQKKLKVKTSKYLKQLETFLFKINNKSIAEEEIRLLLLGNEEKGLPYGLLFCCGSKSKVDGSLRKSSFYTARLLVQILSKHSLKKDFLNIYTDLEEDEYKLMNLSSHILAENQNDMAAYQLVRFVKDKRPHLSLSVIIDGRRVQEKFETWYKDFRKIQVQEEIQQTTWKEETKSTEYEENLMREQRDEKRQKKKKILEHIQLNQQQSSPEFLIKTFQDPLNFERESQLKKNKNQRETSAKKKQLQQLMTLSINNDCELFRNQMKAKGYQLEDIIVKLHIDSKEFDPYVLIQTLHSDTPNQHFQQMLKKLENECHEAVGMNKILVYFFFEDFFVLNNGISKIHFDFISKEHEDSQKRKKNPTGAVSDDQIILGDLQKKNFQMLQQMNKLADHLNEMKKHQFQLRQSLVFIQRFENLIKLPQEIKKAYVQKDYEKIIYEYLSNKASIQRFQSLSIFQKLFEEINYNLMLTFRDILLDIQNEVSDFNRIHQLVSLLLDLPIELAQNYKESDAPGARIILQQNDLKERLDGQKQVIHPTALLIVISIYKKLNEEFQEYMDIEELQESKKEVIDQWYVEKIQGDMVNEFLKEMGLVVRKAEKRKAGRNAVVLNCKSIEKYFQTKFMFQFANFFNLCLKFSRSELDYRMGISKKENLDLELKKKKRGAKKQNQEIEYAQGNSETWRYLIQITFSEMVHSFLSGFENFMKRLQANWFDDDNVSKDSIQFYNRVKSDIESMSNVLYSYEQILLATQYQASDSNQLLILEKTKKIKTEMQVLYMKILLEEFRNVTLKLIDFTDCNVPQQDFFGNSFSQYMNELFQSILDIFKSLGQFALHEGLFTSNKDLFIQYFSKLFTESFTYAKEKLMTINEDIGEEDKRSFKRIRCILFLHNIRVLVPDQPNGMIFELIENIFASLQVQISKRSQINQILQNALNQRLNRRQTRTSIISLYGQQLPFKQFSESAIAQLTQILSQSYQPFLTMYMQILSSEFQPPGKLNLTPRPYVFDWLSILNEQIAQLSLFSPIDPIINDAMISLVITLFNKLLMSDEANFKQLLQEIMLFESMTIRMQGKQSKEGFQKLYNIIQEKCKFEDDAQERKDMIRNSKYKMQMNFKALFGYF